MPYTPPRGWIVGPAPAKVANTQVGEIGGDRTEPQTRRKKKKKKNKSVKIQVTEERHTASLGQNAITKNTSRNTARDHSRQHNGDVIVHGTYNYYETPGGCAHVLTEHAITLSEHQQLILAKLAIVVTLLLTVFERGLCRFIKLLDSIPCQVPDNLAIFEDAFGTISRIDIRFVSDWTAFEHSLCTTFRNRQGKRGLQRVLNSKYRLDNGLGGSLIDPRQRRNFASVFVPGRHIRMSIYFEWHEVQHEACPACGSLEATLPSVETKCSECGFVWRVIEEVDETTDEPAPQSVINAVEAAHDDRIKSSNRDFFRPTSESLDRPDHFQRISIGFQKFGIASVLRNLKKNIKELKNDIAQIHRDAQKAEEDRLQREFEDERFLQKRKEWERRMETPFSPPDAWYRDHPPEGLSTEDYIAWELPEEDDLDDEFPFPLTLKQPQQRLMSPNPSDGFLRLGVLPTGDADVLVEPPSDSDDEYEDSDNKLVRVGRSEESELDASKAGVHAIDLQANSSDFSRGYDFGASLAAALAKAKEPRERQHSDASTPELLTSPLAVSENTSNLVENDYAALVEKHCYGPSEEGKLPLEGIATSQARDISLSTTASVWPGASSAIEDSDSSDSDVENEVRSALVRNKNGELIKPSLAPASKFRRRDPITPHTLSYSKAVHFTETTDQIWEQD